MVTSASVWVADQCHYSESSLTSKPQMNAFMGEEQGGRVVRASHLRSPYGEWPIKYLHYYLWYLFPRKQSATLSKLSFSVRKQIDKSSFARWNYNLVSRWLNSSAVLSWTEWMHFISGGGFLGTEEGFEEEFGCLLASILCSFLLNSLVT